jgi:hypothetical protein
LPLVILAFIGTASAADQAAKPAVPALSDLLDGWGVKLNGYVDATYTVQRDDTDKSDFNSFQLQQAAFTLSKLPTSGFGALVNVVAGQNPYLATGIGTITPGQGATPTNVYLLQGYVQYASGAWTLAAGKFATLAGAEVAAPTGNTNTTRSLLFAYEPVTHSGVRATYTVSDQLSFNVGVNNGWTISQDTADGTSKTGEFGFTYAPSKAVSWVSSLYYGHTPSNYGNYANLMLADTVLTVNATSALSLVGSFDYGSVGGNSKDPSASWWGAAAYINYAWTSKFRTSLRGEYFEDSNGYWHVGYDQKLTEITLTIGYAPVDAFELRLEGRHDSPDKVLGQQLLPVTSQGWLEAIYKF